MRALAPGWQIAGAMVCAVALALMLGAQVRLGASWRMGIEEGARPGLVTGGMYRWCRNPIYAVLDEERYLLATYGDEYRTYASRVGRFVPGVGLRRMSPVT